MHELIHVHVTSTLRRFTTQLIHLFIDVAQCRLIEYVYTIYKNPAPCASILSLRLQCRKLKRWQRPLIRTWSKHCHGKKCFQTEARQKAFLVQGLQSGLKKLFRCNKSFDRHRYHNVIRSCLIELTGCDVTNFLY